VSAPTTTTGADRNSCWATPAASPSADVCGSTTVADAGAWVLAASGSWRENGCGWDEEAVPGPALVQAATDSAATMVAARRPRE
jgi:hypothetical protein